MIEMLELYDKWIEKTSSLVGKLKAYPEIFEKPEHKKFHKFFDKALFTSLNQLDLVIGLKYLDFSQAVGNKLEANYFARVVILNSHEILNDLNKIVGKEIRNDLVLKVGEKDVKDLDDSIKNLNTLRKEHLKTLKELRNKVLGHKLSDAHQQAKMIFKIDLIKVYKIGNEISKVQMKVMLNLTNLISKI